MVARQLPSLMGQIDIIHAWPLAALRTIRAAKKLGIPVAMERCNAHTRYAYESVQMESERIGVKLPPNYEHAYDAAHLEIEEIEYEESSALLCPSAFVVKTFVDQGFPQAKLQRFIYGVDTGIFHPSAEERPSERPFTMIFAGVCAVRKGLHLALEAWLSSDASRAGKFLIAGDFLQAYKDKLAPMLRHPSVCVLGNRKDLPELMRGSDLLVMPSIEEGFGLVCTEAMASGCVPLVSEACTDLCQHLDNALVHKIGDVNTLSEQITLLYQNPELLKSLRASGIENRPNMSWDAAGKSLVDAYRNICGRS
jgi:glycosyltransferase involved in cell wall biosynthesis